MLTRVQRPYLIYFKLKRLKKPYLLALRFRLEKFEFWKKMSKVTGRLKIIVKYFFYFLIDQGTQFDLKIFALISYFYVLKVKYLHRSKPTHTICLLWAVYNSVMRLSSTSPTFIRDVCILYSSYIHVDYIQKSDYF